MKSAQSELDRCNSSVWISSLTYINFVSIAY